MRRRNFLGLGLKGVMVALSGIGISAPPRNFLSGAWSLDAIIVFVHLHWDQVEEIEECLTAPHGAHVAELVENWDPV